jgi:hypothetical protein
MADTPDLHDASVEDLREAAAAADVPGRSSMNKAGLIAALSGVTEQAATPRLDPNLEEIRDSLREREAAEAAAVPPRPQAGIDPKLVAAGRAARAADKASSTPVTSPRTG